MLKKNDKGFTIVELMISMGILIIMISMVTVIFRATQESFMKASSLQKVFETSRNIIQRMHDELSAAFFDSSNRLALIGIEKETTPVKTQSIGDELFFYVPLHEQEGSDVTEIGYWLRDDGNLMRHYEEPSDYDFTTQLADDELGLIVEDLDITYFNGSTYQNTWNSGVNGPEEGLAPKAVRISFLVSDESKLLTRSFDTIVHIATGKRY